jgi:hypothetical protein
MTFLGKKVKIICGVVIKLLTVTACISGLVKTDVFAQDVVSIIFLHHSCGENLIHEGGVREGLTQLGYAFSDHGYNDDGLCQADGQCTGKNFRVPDDNTDPDGLARIFQQSYHTSPDNTFSYLMQYDVIMFKSCYPVSNIGDNSQLEEYKKYYRTILSRMDQYPDKLFIIVTQPPQVPGSSDNSEAERARALTDWLSSDSFLDGHPNVRTFNFFDYLAGHDSYIRKEYRVSNHDAHPNTRANQEIGPIFINFIDNSIKEFHNQMQNIPVQMSPSPEVEDKTAVTVTSTPLVISLDDVEPTDTSPENGGGGLLCPGAYVSLILVGFVLVTRSKTIM